MPILECPTGSAPSIKRPSSVLRSLRNLLLALLFFWATSADAHADKRVVMTWVPPYAVDNVKNQLTGLKFGPDQIGPLGCFQPVEMTPSSPVTPGIWMSRLPKSIANSV